MANNILEEFLISVGYKHDDNAHKKLVDTVTKLHKEFVGFATAATGAALAVVGALDLMARKFEQAYYQSSRTNSSVKEMKAFGYAASQMGSSAEEASAAVETLARKVRENPGYGTLVKGITKDQSNDWTKQLTELGEKFSHMSSAQAHAFAGELGIPENLLLALEKSDEFKSRMADSSRKNGLLGLDPEQAAKDGKALTNAFRDLGDTFSKIGDKVGAGLFKDLQPQIERLNDFLLAHGRDITDMMVKIGDALFKMFDYVVRHLPELDHFVEGIGGWTVALNGLSAVMTATFVLRVASLLSSMTALSTLAPPAWLLGMLGLTAYGSVKIGDAAKGAFDKGFNAVTPGANTPDIIENQNMSAWDRAKKIWRERPAWLGGGGGRASGGSVPLSNEQGGMNEKEVAAYIRSSAVARGIDPDVALKVASNEGLHKYNGDGNSSFGPYQLHFGGVNPAMPHPGLGDEAMKAGIDARDPKTVRQQIDFALNWVRKHGWGDWSGAREVMRQGGRFVGVGPMPKVEPTVAAPTTPSTSVPSSVGGGAFHINQPPMKGWHSSALNSLFSAPPLGSSTSNDNSRTVSMTNNPHIVIHAGASDPTAVAAHVGARANKDASMMLRNLQSAIG